MHLKMSWPKEKGDGGVGVAKKMLSPATRPEQKKEGPGTKCEKLINCRIDNRTNTGGRAPKSRIPWAHSSSSPGDVQLLAAPKCGRNGVSWLPRTKSAESHFNVVAARCTGVSYFWGDKDLSCASILCMRVCCLVDFWERIVFYFLGI